MIGYRFETYDGKLCEVVGEKGDKLLVKCHRTGKVLEIKPLSITVGLATGLFAQCKERSYENIG